MKTIQAQAKATHNATARRTGLRAISTIVAGTAQGNITVWDQTRPDAPKQIVFPRGRLNDLQFSPDEHVLAIASKDLAIYTPAELAGPRLLRSDHANYGTARFSRDGQNLLVITGTGAIQTLWSSAAQCVLFFHLRRCRFYSRRPANR